MTVMPRAGGRAAFDAVVFDLWGTLVPFSTVRRDQVSRRMAADLGVDADEFVAAVRASHAERFAGTTGSLADTVALLAARCGGAPSRARVELAAARRLDFMTAMLAGTAEGTLTMLDSLRTSGLRLGLLSDSSIETPLLWPRSALASRFAAVAFSCLLGVRKPDARIYRHVLSGLGVSAARAAYVGDGDSQELTGAARAGMTAIRFAPPERHEHYEPDAEFRGVTISSLTGLPQALGLEPSSDRGPLD